MEFLKNWLGGGQDPRGAVMPLYASIVAEARDPVWYARLGVPDTLDGRFDMIAALLSLALLRIEAAGDSGRDAGARLTELFIDDMDGQLRQMGIGDVVVGKHIGKMMSAVGGRLAAYRETLEDEERLAEALKRNLWRGEPGADARPELAAARLRALSDRMATVDLATLLAQGLPR